MGFRERRASVARRLCGFLLFAISAVFTLQYTNIGDRIRIDVIWASSNTPSSDASDNTTPLGGTSRSASAIASSTLSSAKGSIVFSCPDGRIGLHVVHTRYLISQADVGLLFIASRLHLMETFMVPSLAAQTSKNFVLYASYDPELSNATVQSFKDTIALIPVHSIYNPETSTSGMALGFKELTERLATEDPRVKKAELLVISRLDIDDGAHVGAVEAIQQHACSSPSGEPSNVTSSSGISNPSNVRLMYITNGTLWFPTRDPLGVIRVPRPQFKIYRNLAVMQSIILAESTFLASCRIDVYSYPHYKPQALETMTFPSCPEFEFRAERDVHRWAPPPGEFGWLYSKTTSSWTAGQIDHKKSSSVVPMDIEALQRSFAIDKAGLAVANLMFTGLAKQASALLEGSTELALE